MRNETSHVAQLACRQYPPRTMDLVDAAVIAIARGEVAQLGSLMSQAQTLFDSCLAPVPLAVIENL